MRCSVLITLLALGCGAEHHADREAAPPAPARADALAQVRLGVDTAPAAAASMAEAKAGERALPTEGAVDRKIVYTAEVDLVVEDFDPLPEQVRSMARQFDGFVAGSNVAGSPGSPRIGEWTIRVPVARYDEFLTAARQLGEVRRESSDSQDVTEEYYDVEARIRNKKTEETRLLKLLEDATGELEDILAVEREVSRVREEIERMEGRLRVLTDLTSLTTVNLSIEEIRDYVPDAAPSYGTRVRRGFQGSIDALLSAMQGLSIALIVLLPWLVVLLVLGVVLFPLWRFVRVRRAR